MTILKPTALEVQVELDLEAAASCVLAGAIRDPIPGGLSQL